jgi:hypothetical protein
MDGLGDSYIPSPQTLFAGVSKKSTNQKQEMSVVAMFVNRSEINEQSLLGTFQGCFLPYFESFGQAVTEEKIL